MSRIGKQPIPVPERRRGHHRRPPRHGEGPEGHARARRSPATSRSARTATSSSSSGPTTSARTARCTASPARWSTTWSSASPRASRKELEIVGVGYRATAQGPTKLELALGFSPPGRGRRARRHHLRGAGARPASSCAGIDKQLVGQVAADIRKIRKPEPYKGKGVRYAGERVLRKAGKAAK